MVIWIIVCIFAHEIIIFIYNIIRYEEREDSEKRDGSGDDVRRADKCDGNGQDVEGEKKSDRITEMLNFYHWRAKKECIRRD